jgi:transposase-like protein
MPKYNTLDDGSLLYESPIEIQNRFYTVDPNNPCRVLINFKTCKRRELKLRKKECGMQRGTFRCNKFNKVVTPADCEVCDAAEQE